MLSARNATVPSILGPSVLLWVFAIHLTYILNVIHTWHGTTNVAMKLFVNMTLDLVLAAIWPVTWIVWGVERYLGQSSPLDLLM